MYQQLHVLDASAEMLPYPAKLVCNKYGGPVQDTSSIYGSETTCAIAMDVQSIALAYDTCIV